MSAQREAHASDDKVNTNWRGEIQAETSSNLFSKYPVLPKLDLSTLNAGMDSVAVTEREQPPAAAQQATSNYDPLPAITAGNEGASGGEDGVAEGSIHHQQSPGDPRQQSGNDHTARRPSGHRAAGVRSQDVSKDHTVTFWKRSFAREARMSHQSPSTDQFSDPRHPPFPSTRHDPPAPVQSLPPATRFRDPRLPSAMFRPSPIASVPEPIMAPRRSRTLQPLRHVDSSLYKRQSLRPRSSNVLQLGGPSSLGGWSTNYRNDFQKRQALEGGRAAGASFKSLPLSLGAPEPASISWRDIMPGRNSMHVYP